MVLRRIAVDLIDELVNHGNWLGLAEVYTEPLGVIAPSLVILTLSLAAYIRTQSIEYVVGIWFLIGAGIEIFLPGPALALGRVLMILGIFGLLLKIFLGKRLAYG